MEKVGLVFDLDMTLVDSSVAEAARKNRCWAEVYRLIPQFTLYKGLEKVFQYIKQEEFKMGILSSAPSSYIRRVVCYFDIPVYERCIFGYYETGRIVKPDPYPFRICQRAMKMEPVNLISFGDRAIDMQASRAARIDCAACFWGTQEPGLLAASPYDYAIQKPIDIINLLKSLKL